MKKEVLSEQTICVSAYKMVASKKFFKIFERMNVNLQNITGFATAACYDVAIKQRRAKSKPSERMGHRVEGPKVFKLWQSDYWSFQQPFQPERRTRI